MSFHFKYVFRGFNIISKLINNLNYRIRYAL